MCFDFPPKKGSGISRLIPNCPAPALSLLYQMLAYDPDERISAQMALQHTYFREIRWNSLTLDHSPLKMMILPFAVGGLFPSRYIFAKQQYGTDSHGEKSLNSIKLKLQPQEKIQE